MKDHEIAQVINNVTHVARLYGQTQQIRERVRRALEPVLKGTRLKRDPLSEEERKALRKSLSDMDEGSLMADQRLHATTSTKTCG